MRPSTAVNSRCQPAALTRVDGWCVQVGLGQWTGTRAGWYAWERQDGDPERHFRTEVSDIEEVIGMLVGFSEYDDAATKRFLGGR